MSSLKVHFAGSGGTDLAARLDLPDRAPRAFAVFAHCFTCSKDTKAPTYIARALVEAGLAVLRFDFTGLGGSEGEFENTNFTSNVDDLLAAARYLRETQQAPALLVGHSLGGAAVLAAAQRVPECKAVVTIGAPFEPQHVTRQFREQLQLIEREGAAEVTLAGRTFRINKSFLDDVGGQPQSQRIGELRRPLLVLHAPNDAVVGIDNARAIFEAAKHPKSFVALDGADHMLTRREDGGYVGQLIASWAARYLPAAASSTVPEDTVRVSERGLGKFANLIETARHSITADEPAAVGGNDSGLTPYELLAAALGACTSMTLRMYADLKKLPLARVSVDVQHAKIHATDCAECETKEGKIDRLVRTISLTGELSAEQRAKLLEIADKCPVHRTLHGEVSVVSELAG